MATSIAEIQPDGRMAFSFVSDRWLQLYGLSRAQFMADQGLAIERIHPDDRQSVFNSHRRALAERVAFSWEGRLLVRGEIVWVAIECHPRSTETGQLVWHGVMIDVSARRRAEIPSLAVQNQQRALLEHLPTAIAVTSLTPPRRVLYVNRQFLRAFGYTLEDIPTVADWARLAYPDAADRAEAMASWDAAIAEATTGDGQIDGRELKVICKGGAARDVMISASVIDDMLITAFVDITARRQTERRLLTDRVRAEQALIAAKEEVEIANQALKATNLELKALATTDRLTGVHNRWSFEQAVLTEAERLHRYGEPLSLMLFDIDHFKSINDTHGHQAGDHVLAELTRRIRAHLRAIDVPARLGGDEFAVVLPHCDIAQAQEAAERLRALIEGEEFPDVGRVTSSFGVAQFVPDDTLDTALKRADDALYAAKAAGRNAVRADHHPA